MQASPLSKPPISDPRRTLTLRDVSEASGVSEMTVSRVLRRMQDDGVLAVERREVELLDPARLETLAAPILRD